MMGSMGLSASCNSISAWWRIRRPSFQNIPGYETDVRKREQQQQEVERYQGLCEDSSKILLHDRGTFRGCA